MKPCTMYARVVLVFSLCLSNALCALATCDYREGEQPVPVLNSYYSFVDGNFCCPLNYADSKCKPEKEMNCLCPHGLVKEPCRHCLTCAKGLGEECGGTNGINGECMDGLDCSADPHLYLDGGNVTGICYDPVPRVEYESCGGVYPHCKVGLNCTELVGPGVHVCIAPTTNLKQVCFKNCTERKKDEVCGTDGRFYYNVCFLRQRGCLGHIVRPSKSRQTCTQNVCEPMSTPSNGSVVYTHGNITNSSNITIDCNSDFETIYYDATPEIVVTFPANLTCVCESPRCAWRYGSNDDNTLVEFTNLPKCINTREKNCQEAAEDSEETPKQIIQNKGRSNSA